MRQTYRKYLAGAGQSMSAFRTSLLPLTSGSPLTSHLSPSPLTLAVRPSQFSPRWSPLAVRPSQFSPRPSMSLQEFHTKVSCSESFMLHVVNSKTSKVDNLLKLNITFDRAFQHVHCFIYNWIFSMFNNLLSRLLCPGSASG